MCVLITFSFPVIVFVFKQMWSGHKIFKKALFQFSYLCNPYLLLVIPTLQSGDGAVFPCSWIEWTETVYGCMGCKDGGRRQVIECCCFIVGIHSYFLVSFHDRLANSN